MSFTSATRVETKSWSISTIAAMPMAVPSWVPKVAWDLNWLHSRPTGTQRAISGRNSDAVAPHVD